MNHLLPLLFASIALSLVAPVSAAVRPRWPDGSYRWTPADSVSIRYFGLIEGLGDNAFSKPIGVSPGGRYFYVLSYRGDIQVDKNIHTMDIYESQKVTTWLDGAGTELVPPLRTVEMQSGRGTSSATFSGLRWDENGEALSFIGLDERGRKQVYRLELPHGSLQALTKESQDVVAAQGSPTTSKNVAIYLRNGVDPRDRPPPKAANYPVVVLPRTPNGAVGLRNTEEGNLIETQKTAIYSAKSDLWELPLPVGGVTNAWISPNENFAVLLFQARSEIGKHRYGRYLLANLVRKALIELGEASNEPNSTASFSPRVFWSKDSETFIIAGIKSPAIESGSPSVVAGTAANGLLAGLEPIVKGDQQIADVGWLPGGEHFVITHQVGNERSASTIYARKDNQWVGQLAADSARPEEAKESALPRGLSVIIDQSANTPPRVIVSSDNKQRTLSRPDPALAGLWFAQGEPFTWTMPDGTKKQSYVFRPPNSEGTRLPLVIQFDGEPSSRYFLPDSPYYQSYSRQSLVSRGLAVVSLDPIRPPARGTEREGPEAVARIDAVVEALTRDGVIDPTRVGIIGFSRSGYFAFYAATHPGRTAITAIGVNDSITFSFPAYLERAAAGAANSSGVRNFEGINGSGKTFWQNKAAWLERDVLFNLDRMQAAALFIDHGSALRGAGLTGADYMVSSLASVAALGHTRRKFDYLFIPEGGHGLVVPQQRYASISLNVDWMDFWLNGQEDPDPEKIQQYQRWRAIRSEWKDQRTIANEIVH
jgi:dipeptidyl aminopeptidase/acylaminoacyl peptidase